MDTLIYWPARALVALIQALPLTLVARLGRAGGGLAFWLDARHRRVALQNLTMCFGQEKSPEEIRALARENFRRIGENFASAVKTAAMTSDELRPHIEFAGIERLPQKAGDGRRAASSSPSATSATSSLYARFQPVRARLPDAPRPIARSSSRRSTGSCRNCASAPAACYFERRTDGPLLRAGDEPARASFSACSPTKAPTACAAPFLGHDCSTTLAPAVFALRYHCELYTAICYPRRPGEMADRTRRRIPTHENGQPRSVRGHHARREPRL